MSTYASTPDLDVITDDCGMRIDVADSSTEGLVRLALYSDDPRWNWTHIYLGPAEADRVADALRRAAELARDDR